MQHEDDAVTEAHDVIAPPEEAWDDEPEADFLPPRPRGRLLRPLTVVLFVLLAASAGFLVGVIVEKGQVPAGSGAGGGGRFAALRAAAAASGGGGGAAALFGGGGGGAGGGGAVAGQVSSIDGSTLYVTDFSGNTIKVKTHSSSRITKSVKTHVHEIHPGDTVVVQGATASDGTVTASSVRDSGSSGGGGAGGASSTGSGGTGAGTGGGGGGVNSLFGPPPG